MRCVLVGNYGVGNIGDEALREYFLFAFPDVEWLVVSANPKNSTDIPRLPMGIRSFFTPWWKTIFAIRSADAVVFGGGSLFTDIESVWACVLWRMYAIVAKFFGTPYILAFQGVGPFLTKLGERLASKTYEEAAAISVRDEDSMQRLASMKMRASPVVSFDPAFAYFIERGRSLPQKEGRNLVIIPRLNSKQNFFDRAFEFASSKWDSITIVLLEPEKEQKVARHLAALLPSSTIVKIHSVDELLAAVSGASFVFSQRFHGALAALALQKEFEVLPQKEGDKMDTLRNASKLPECQEDWVRRIATGKDHLNAVFQGIRHKILAK